MIKAFFTLSDRACAKSYTRLTRMIFHSIAKYYAIFSFRPIVSLWALPAAYAGIAVSKLWLFLEMFNLPTRFY
jgi:hypothetical protein